jgi:hypothetical protein
MTRTEMVASASAKQHTGRQCNQQPRFQDTVTRIMLAPRYFFALVGDGVPGRSRFARPGP